jgi:trimeric autotransporter adhesin
MSFRIHVGLALSLLAACGDNHPDPGTSPDAGPVTPDGAPGDAPPDAPPDAPDAPPPVGPAAGMWRDRFVLPGLSGTHARVEAIVRGSDDRLYAGGTFTAAAGVPVHNVAAWNGTVWEPLGAAPGEWVRDLVVDEHGALWAAANANNVLTATLSKWDGAAWIASPAVNGEITDAAAVPNGIVAVGTFTDAGGAGADSVAFFNGTSWSPLGGGTISGAATAVAVAQDGAVCVAGAFDAIDGVTVQNAACWDGREWTPLGVGLPGGVTVLVQHPDGRWFAGGTLNFLVPGSYRAGIAELVQGHWQPFNDGIDSGSINHVRTIAFHDGYVYVGGNFGSAGRGANAVVAQNVARWHADSGWQEVAGGARTDVGFQGASTVGPYAFLVDDNGDLWVGGLFSRIGDTPANSIAMISAFLGTPSPVIGNQVALGLGGFADDLAIHAGAVLAGGNFRYAGTSTVTSLAQLEGGGWTTIGPDGTGVIDGIVRDILIRHDGSLAIAGELIVDGRGVAFAQWDGTQWVPLGGAVIGVGFAMAEDADGNLWLGGDLDGVGTLRLRNIARLDGTTWKALGGFDGRVSALVLHDGKMHAGGLFDHAGTLPARGLAVYEGDVWRELAPLDALGYVTALASSPAFGLVVGGSFATVDEQALPSLAAFDGTTWRGFGTLHGSLGPAFVASIAPYGGGLFVSGGFYQAHSTNAARIAWFDGTTWWDLDGGLDDHAESLLVDGNTLWVGGPFTAAGGRPSSALAAWDFPATAPAE